VTNGKPTPTEMDLSDVEWVVSSFSGGGGDCVRIGVKDGFALVGDTKNQDRPPHVFTPSEARAWLQGAKAGEFDFLLDL
jgi:hypothetical protein